MNGPHDYGPFFSISNNFIDWISSSTLKRVLKKLDKKIPLYKIRKANHVGLHLILNNFLKK